MIYPNQELRSGIANIVSVSNTAIVQTEIQSLTMMVAMLSLMYDLTDEETEQLTRLSYTLMSGLPQPVVLRNRMIEAVFDIKGKR